VINPLTVSAGDMFHSLLCEYRHVPLRSRVSAARDAFTPILISYSSVRDSLWRCSLR
jgi:hypothetical protein